MAQVSEIDVIRKKRRRKIFFQRFLLLLTLTLAGIGIYVAKDEVNTVGIADFFRATAARLAPGQEFPLDYVGGPVSGMYHAGRNLVVLTDTNLLIYSPGGRELRNIQHKFSNPTVRIAGTRVLLYDRGGKKLRVESFTRTVSMKEFEYPIYAAALSGRGDVAVATGAQHRTGELSIYQQDFLEAPKFVWKTSEHYITEVAFSRDGKSIAAATVAARGGEVFSAAHQFRVTSPEKEAQTNFEDAVIHAMEYDKAGLHVVTDRQTALLGEDGKIQQAYDYAGESLMSYDRGDGGETALLFGDFRENQTSSLVVLDEQCVEVWEKRISNHTNLLSLGAGTLGLVADGKLVLYNKNGQETKRVALGFTPLAMELVDTDALFITPETVEKLPLG